MVADPRVIAARYAAWTAESERLVHEWLTRRKIPRVDAPIVHHWASMDGGESHAVILWTETGFDLAWSPLVHAVIEEACVRNRGAWNYQWPSYCDAYGRFFDNRSSAAILNLIFVTPSRAPSGIWTIQGRPALIEEVDPNPAIPFSEKRGKSLRLAELGEFSLKLESLVWIDRPLASGKRLQLVHTTAYRRFRHYRMTLERLFEIDPTGEEPDDVIFGVVPALREAVKGEGLLARTHAPMIQMMRLDAEGMADLLMFETHRDSGQLIDIRWGRQSFEAMMVHDPYFAVALDEAFRKGRRLKAQ